MGSFTSVWGIGPEKFQFNGQQVQVGVDSGNVQKVIDYFKEWLPLATRRLKYVLEQEAHQSELRAREKLRLEKLAEEERLRVLKNLKI